MKKIFLMLMFFVISAAGVYAAPDFYVLDVKGIIDAANSDYIIKGIARAEKEGAEAVILAMDTPGGLMKSMRKIIDKILNSRVPVVAYVSPSGARAASAGTFILLASHVAAMAPGTNLGTASPVNMQGDKTGDKVTNDSIAYIKNLARLNNRNEEWAEKTITENISSSEEEAKEQKVIEITALNLEQLINRLDGMTVAVNEKEKVLNSKDYTITNINMSPKHKFLHSLSDPNVSYIMFMVGIYGIIYELSNPGGIFPIVAGTISIVLAFVGFDSIPINTAGMILIILAIVLFIAEAMTTAFGLLFGGGVISLIIGSVILFPARELGDAWAPSYALIAGVTAVTIIFFAVIIWVVIKAHRKKIISGIGAVIGEKGTAETDILDKGIVNIGGEEWQAYSDEFIGKRDLVEVLEKDGMKLKVKKIPRNRNEKAEAEKNNNEEVR